MSIPQDVALELAARVSQITIANGYATDVGLRVYRGRRRLTPEHLPCVVLIERKTTPIEQSKGDAKVAAGFVLEGHSECDPDNPNDMGHALEADIMQAVFTTPEFTYGSPPKKATYEYGGTEISPREDGQKHVQTAVDVTVSYVVRKAKP